MLKIEIVKNKRKCHTCSVDVKQDGKIVSYGTGMYNKNVCPSCIKKLLAQLEETNEKI